MSYFPRDRQSRLVNYSVTLNPHLKQTLKDFEERRVPIDVCVCIFDRTPGVILLIWAQEDFYGTFGAGQMDGQTLEEK